MNRQSRHRRKRERRHEGSRLPLDIILNKYIGGRPYLCRASNLSRGGLLVHRVREPNNSETRVGLQFQLPGDNRVITCAGEIVHEHGWVNASGIRFTSISTEHRALIDSYLERVA
jgi:hypothetical protein